MLYLIGSSPNPLVRGVFFTVYLFFISFELEEYQLNLFITTLKGSQFIAGAIALLQFCFAFFSCTVMTTKENLCATEGPGVFKENDFSVPQVKATPLTTQ